MTNTSVEFKGNEIATKFFCGQATFAAYYNHYYGRLVDHSMRISKGDEDLAVTVVNDLLLKLTSKDSSYRYDPTKSHLSYLMTAVLRYTIMEKKKKKRIVCESSLMSKDEDSPIDYYANAGHAQPDEWCADEVTHNDVKLAIGKLALSESDEVVQAAILTDASYEDIKHRFDLNSDGAIKTRVFRFKKRLRASHEAYLRYLDWATGLDVTGKIASYRYNKQSGQATKHVDSSVVGGVLNGEYIEYHPNGNTMVSARYKMGILHGNYAKYHPDGAISEECTYKNGAIVSRDVYSKSGTLIRKERKEGQSTYVAIYDGEDNLLYEDITS